MMNSSRNAISELLAILIIIVIGAAITAGVLLLLPGQSGTNPRTTSVSFISTITSFQGTILPTTARSTTNNFASSATPATSCTTSFFDYPQVFNQTLLLENDTLISPSGDSSTISVPPHGTLYIGFNLPRGAQELSG